MAALLLLAQYAFADLRTAAMCRGGRDTHLGSGASVLHGRVQRRLLEQGVSSDSRRGGAKGHAACDDAVTTWQIKIGARVPLARVPLERLHYGGTAAACSVRFCGFAKRSLAHVLQVNAHGARAVHTLAVLRGKRGRTPQAHKKYTSQYVGPGGCLTRETRATTCTFGRFHHGETGGNEFTRRTMDIRGTFAGLR